MALKTCPVWIVLQSKNYQTSNTMGHQASTPQTSYPYVDRNVGRQPHYIKMNMGRLAWSRQPPVYISRYECMFTITHIQGNCTFITSIFITRFINVFNL